MPLKPNKNMDHVFAIVRVDDLDAPDEERITVKEILGDADAARKEVERLNGLKKGGARYFSQVTRLERRSRMTPELMKRAGEMTQQDSWTDAELEEAIKGTTLALAYLRGRGSHWSLAITPLTLELSQLERYRENRKLDGKWKLRD